MANIFNEVDEDIRKERYKSLWKNYGKYVVGFILTIIIVFSFSQFYQKLAISNNSKILDNYLLAMENIENKKYQEAKNILDLIYLENNDILKAMSKFQLSIIESYEGNNDLSLKELEEIFNNSTLDETLRQLALYKFFIINFDKIDLSEMNILINSQNINNMEMSFYFDELIGLKYLLLSENKSANEVFLELSTNNNTPFDLRIRLEKLIQISE